MSTAEPTAQIAGRKDGWLVAGSTVVVLIAGLAVPGGGLVAALVLYFTLLREHRTAAKWMLGLGFALLLLALGAQQAPWAGTQTVVGPPQVAQQVITP